MANIDGQDNILVETKQEHKIANFKGVIPYVPRTKEALKHALKEIELEEVRATDTLKLSKEEIHDVCLQQISREQLYKNNPATDNPWRDVTGTVTLADDATMLPVQLVIEKGNIVKIIIKGKIYARHFARRESLMEDYPLGVIYVHERSYLKEDILAVVSVCMDFIILAKIHHGSDGRYSHEQELQLLY